MDSEQTNSSRLGWNERYYTELVQISTDEGADNELARAALNEKLQRGWRLVMLTPGTEANSVELVWETSGG